MICPYCHKENYNGVSICVFCGTILNPVQNTRPINPYQFAQAANPYTPNPQQQYINNNNEVSNKTAKKLAIISLSLFAGRYVLRIIGTIFKYVFSYPTGFYSYSLELVGLLINIFAIGASFLCFVASLVLIIIAKAKVSSKKLKNKFVNVVFLVEIGLIIASVSIFLLRIILYVVSNSYY